MWHPTRLEFRDKKGNAIGHIEKVAGGWDVWHKVHVSKNKLIDMGQNYFKLTESGPAQTKKEAKRILRRKIWELEKSSSQ